MCYSIYDTFDLKKEVTYNASLLYRTNGYRIDYNNIQVKRPFLKYSNT